MDFNSKYKSSEIEQKLDDVEILKNEIANLGKGFALDVTVVSSLDEMTDTTKFYALNGEVYRFEGIVGEVELVPQFTNYYDKSNAQINTRVSTSSTSTMNGAMLTNWLDIPMNPDINTPVVRIKGLPNPSTFATHDYDRVVCLKDGEEYRTSSGAWEFWGMKNYLNNGYTKELLDDGTLVLTMESAGLPSIFGDNATAVISPRFCFQDILGDGSAITEAPDLIITLNEEIAYKEVAKGSWVNTHVKYYSDASQMIINNLADIMALVNSAQS